MSSYPEHDKLKKVAAQSQACGDFLAWLREVKDLQLCVPHQHDDSCYCVPKDEERRGVNMRVCDLKAGEYIAAGLSTTKLLAEFFGIDVDKLEAEKQQLLEEQRALNAGSE